jgi:hypothetical protein
MLEAEPTSRRHLSKGGFDDANTLTSTHFTNSPTRTT